MKLTDNPGFVSPASDASGAAAPGQTDAPHSPAAELSDLDRLMAELGDEGDGISAAESTPDAKTDLEDSAADGDTETESDPDEDEAEGDASDADSEDGEDDEEKEETPKEEKPKSGGMPKAIAETLKAANVPKGIMDRIGKTFEKARERAAEVERLTAELANAGPVAVLQPEEASPLSAVRTEADLAKSEQAAEAWLEWAMDHPNGGTLPDGRELDADQVKATQRKALAVVREAPKRRQWLAEYAESAKAVRAEMPELFKEGTPEYRAGQIFIQKCPELLKVSDHHRFLQWAVAGLRMQQEAAAGKKTVTVDPKAMREAGERLKAKTAAAKPAARPAQPASRPAPASAQTSREARLKAAEQSRDVDAQLDVLLNPA